MVICKAKYRNFTNSIVLQTRDLTIEQVHKIKALGMYFTSNLSNLANINNIVSKVNFRRNVLCGVFIFSDYKTKLILTNSLIVSVIRYCCPLLIDSNVSMINRLQTLLMKCTRNVLGFKSYKMSTMKIMSTMKLLTIHHMIVKETIMFVHKIFFNNSTNSILKLFTYSINDRTNLRANRKPIIKKRHMSEKVTQSLLYRALFLYSKLEDETRIYNPKKHSKYLQENIIYIFPNNKIQKYEKK